jgi:hypothetical protein
MTERVGVGWRCHSGWAVVVVASGSEHSPVVLDRRRVELVSDSLPRQPYHAVAESGAATSVIDLVAGDARRAVHETLQAIGRADAVGLVAPERRIPPSVDRILASHALLHAAEGHLYERAVIEVADDVGLEVHVVAPRSIEVSAAVDSLRRAIGPPWQKDHKWAMTAALGALAGP